LGFYNTLCPTGKIDASMSEVETYAILENVSMSWGMKYFLQNLFVFLLFSHNLYMQQKVKVVGSMQQFLDVRTRFIIFICELSGIINNLANATPNK
jgi:hypothetical protein